MTVLADSATARSKARISHAEQMSIDLQAGREGETLDSQFGLAKERNIAANESLDSYFAKNVIHKRISFDIPRADNWINILILDGQKSVFLESREETDLIADFIDRKESEIESLKTEIEESDVRLFSAELATREYRLTEKEAAFNLKIAEFQARIADAKSKLALIRLMNGLIDR